MKRQTVTLTLDAGTAQKLADYVKNPGEAADFGLDLSEIAAALAAVGIEGVCRECGGSGREFETVEDDTPCAACDGIGR